MIIYIYIYILLMHSDFKKSMQMATASGSDGCLHCWLLWWEKVPGTQLLAAGYASQDLRIFSERNHSGGPWSFEKWVDNSWLTISYNIQIFLHNMPCLSQITPWISRIWSGRAKKARLWGFNLSQSLREAHDMLWGSWAIVNLANSDWFLYSPWDQ